MSGIESKKSYIFYEDRRKSLQPVKPGSVQEQYFSNGIAPTDLTDPLPTSWMEVDLSAIDHNVEQIMHAVDGQADIIAVGKYDFMGHGGGRMMADRIIKKGAEKIAIASVEEAMQLREEGYKDPLLLLYPVTDHHLLAALKMGTEITITSFDQAQKVAEIASHENIPLAKVHIKVATGFNHYRAVSPGDVVDILNGLRNFSNIKVEGICSHFATAGDDEQLTKKEFSTFLDVLKVAAANGHSVPSVHIANSAAVTMHKDTWNTQMYQNIMPGTRASIRPGGLIYGLYGDPGGKLETQGALSSVVSHIADIHNISPGENVGYCATYTAPKDMRIATIPMGWGSGYNVENKGSQKSDILINGRRAPIVGLVGASSFAVECDPNATVGQRVQLIGEEDGIAIPPDELAERFGYLSSQLVLSLGRGMHRVYTERK